MKNFNLLLILIIVCCICPLNIQAIKPEISERNGNITLNFDSKITTSLRSSDNKYIIERAKGKSLGYCFL